MPRKTGTVFLPFDELAGYEDVAEYHKPKREGWCSADYSARRLTPSGVYTLEDDVTGTGVTYIGSPGYTLDKAKLIAGADSIRRCPNGQRRHN